MKSMTMNPPSSTTAETIPDEAEAEPSNKDYSEAPSSSWHTDTGASVSDAIGHKKLAVKERASLGKEETRQVWRLRGMVYLAILVVAAVISIFIYFAMLNGEVVEFHTQFRSFATKIVASVDENLEHKMEAAHSLANAMTSYAETANATFPFVTLPHMAIVGSNVRIQAESIAIEWLPLVTDDNRDEWEAYAMEHQGWLAENHDEEVFQQQWQVEVHDLEEGEIQESIDIAEEDDLQDAYEMEPSYEMTAEDDLEEDTYEQGNSTRAMMESMQNDADDSVFGTFHPHIFNSINNGVQGVPAPNGTGPYLPLWQMSPVLPTRESLNLNMLTREDLQEALTDALEHKMAVIGAPHAIVKHHDGTDDGSSTKEIMEMGQYRHKDISKYSGGPATSLVYPVFDGFGPERQMGGLLALDMYWIIYLKDILAAQVRGVVVVLQSKDMIFTYQVDGPDVTFVGEGDLHDAKYDALRFSKDVTKQIVKRAGPHNQAYGAVDLDMEHHHYYLHVYPSEQLESIYLTAMPLIFTLVVIAVFLFTIGVFMTYDYYVEQRQVLVMDRAVQSTAIVSSLYPEHVRDRLFQDAEAPSEKKQTEDAFKNAGMGRTLDTTGEDEINHDGAVAREKDMPIADKYENTTILFADLAGFTKWSSTRRPEEVFLLLETLYQAFDRIATRRRVFKVETIGDCYVAATGLPNPQADHAVIMTKFARDCQSKMNQILNGDILSKLGEDTKDLGFRVGMHSGSITGGVLRGQKARFQLFGDTMNTASRMESNGVKGRIHVSEATAEELRKRGKGAWLTPREEKVDFKGKGVMQTYFVHVGVDSKTNDERSCLSGDSGVSGEMDASYVVDHGEGAVEQESTPENSTDLKMRMYDGSDEHVLVPYSGNDLPRPYDSFQKGTARGNSSNKEARKAVNQDE